VNNIIELNKLQKHFKPDTVLMGVDLCLKEHSVLGLLGVNGAGKTTLIRCALGLLKPSMGEAKIFGHSAWDMPPEVKAKIGKALRGRFSAACASMTRANFVGGGPQWWRDGYAENLAGGHPVLWFSRMLTPFAGERDPRNTDRGSAIVRANCDIERLRSCAIVATVSATS
jgi:energy-coupling factor transporter ATP-binding protein EcfA2